ncbi:LD-carboxypeptidase [Synechococcus sp. CBW1107]|uniref:S66 peptidase family protein n=1 Tax=Synechococcus sp. CBW1107 TaxID=2789857 RepID=UPI002AD483A7|nr:LD-carboxypeptidase [Synechococcus sp. CBW1107]CAK6699886.1 putative murein peptide carboxypeptidase [Synechococcus sp. CBW1107]
MSQLRWPQDWPRPLRRGDRVQLVAASSALIGPDAPDRLTAGAALLQRWGLQLEPSQPERLLGRRWGYLAGRDAERAADLDAAAALLACVRGGWGSARLLERPLSLPDGWLLGFSDVTSLLWAQQARGRRGGIHGPLLTTLATEPRWSQERLRALLFGEPLPPLSGVGWQAGVAEGPLLVANLTVATHLLGTAHLPELRGAILILEDVGEAPYRIERMLTHWRLCGALQGLAGIGFGSFLGCDEPTEEPPQDDEVEANGASQHDGASEDNSLIAARGAAGRFSLEQVLRERTQDLEIPVVAGLPVGHAPGNAALPIGAPARLDGRLGTLEVGGI